MPQTNHHRSAETTCVTNEAGKIDFFGFSAIRFVTSDLFPVRNRIGGTTAKHRRPSTRGITDMKTETAMNTISEAQQLSLAWLEAKAAEDEYERVQQQIIEIDRQIRKYESAGVSL